MLGVYWESSMNIQIKTIDHNQQRYNTVGDYWVDKDGIIQIRISEMGNDDYEFLVMNHELQEIYLCLKRGIKFEEIDKYDIDFEKNRDAGKYDICEEPGDSKDSPYFKEHRFASIIERLVSHELEVDYSDYEKKVIELMEFYEK